MEEIEIWKDVLGYEGLYQVSNLGRVKSLSRKVKFGWSYRITPSVIVNPSLRKRKSEFEIGYYVVGLHKDGKTKYIYIHRLVALHFIPNTDNKPQIDHIDGDTSNNKASNLRWCTAKENNNFEIHRLRQSLSQTITHKRNRNEH